MIEILRMGENQIHEADFDVNRPNGHPHYLLLLTRTSGRFLVNSVWQTVPAHCGFLFAPGQQHRYHPIEDFYIDDWMHIASAQSMVGSHFPFGTPIPLHNPEDYHNLFHMIHNTYFETGAERPLTLHHLTMALLSKLSDELQTHEFPNLHYQLINLRKEIYSHPEQDWNVPAMAADLNISAGYLHTIYQQLFHTSCMNDVITSRLQTACDLLRSTSKPISEIALCCGYRNTEHFIRQFKKHMEITPGKYR